jgi:hypothetical protein
MFDPSTLIVMLLLLMPFSKALGAKEVEDVPGDNMVVEDVDVEKEEMDEEEADGKL